MLKDRTGREIVLLSAPQEVLAWEFTLDENFMVALTPENAAKAKAAAQTSLQEQKKLLAVYERCGKSLTEYSVDELTDIIGAITCCHATGTPKENVTVMARYIADHREDIFARLQNGDAALVDELADGTMTERREKCLANKVCALLGELEYGQQAFISHEKLLRTVLPYYLRRYGAAGAGETERCTHARLVELTEGVLASLPQPIALHEADHLLWFVYRNDPVRTAIAVALANEKS